MRRTGSAYAAAALIGAAFASGCSFDLAEVIEPAAGSGGSKPSVDPKNILANPSFETGTTNWGGHDASVASREDPDAPDGCCIARVTRDPAPTMSDYFSIQNNNMT